MIKVLQIGIPCLFTAVHAVYSRHAAPAEVILEQCLLAQLLHGLILPDKVQIFAEDQREYLDPYIAVAQLPGKAVIEEMAVGADDEKLAVMLLHELCQDAGPAGDIPQLIQEHVYMAPDACQEFRQHLPETCRLIEIGIKQAFKIQIKDVFLRDSAFLHLLYQLFYDNCLSASADAGDELHLVSAHIHLDPFQI